ncbi:16185_t:CDS:2, partial [Cetraspora pellucida]
MQINSDNSKIINPVTDMLSNNCLQDALACYYAHKDGYTEHLERIFTKKDYKQYLDIKEETATPKPVIASKNYNRQHIIYLMALTDITKSKDDKYGQKNHFLCIKNPNGLVYKDNAKKHCFGLGEATQRVKLPTKADFEADNKKCDEKYGGQMRKLAEQKANSFCYLVHWIDTGKHDRIETEEDKKKFAKTNTCWICKDKFDTDNKDKIELWKTPIPIVFHNFRGYDSHLVCESVGKSVNAYQIKVIAETFERYKSMKCKGVYSYEYIDSQDRFLETELPPIHEFSTYLH